MKKLIATLLLAFSMTATAGVDTGTDDNGVILAGHDTVAYHTKGKAVLGNAKYTAVYNDAIYRFANKRNRDLFVAKPAKYAPAYGGYCAYGTSIGQKFQVNGEAFQIVDGQLYVNKNAGAHEAWREDIPGRVKKANGHWPNIVQVPAEQL